MRRIAIALGINLFYGNATFVFSNNIVIEKSTKQREWMLFAHELCHYLRHAGLQVAMPTPFINLQEWQAKQFAYHFCVPTFMLDELEEVTVYEIMNQFNVVEEFAEQRLEMYKNKHYWRVQHEKRGNCINSSIL